ncbi:MAG: heme-binding protein [Sulfuricaulis sp.]|nr:heme-binding protein [Sulfuricaulis sp.]
MLLGIVFSFPVQAADVLNVKLMTLDLARDIANHTLETCRKQGYQTAVVVVDRAGDPQVVLRDVYVSRHAIEIAARKASAVILSGVSSGEFRKNRADIHAELNEIQGVLLLQGGLPIRAGGSLIGAVGVSGAPGGEKDEACAAAGIKAAQERLDFAE